MRRNTLHKYIAYDIIARSKARKLKKGCTMYELEYYETQDGKIPLYDFFAGLNTKLYAKVLRDIDLLEEFGAALTMPHVKHLDGDLWELRTKFSSDITRIVYFTFSKGQIVLLNGFVKKSDKTPKNELDKAKRYMQDWKERHKP